MILMVKIILNDNIFYDIFHLGNGYIEGHELDDLLRELVSSVNTSDANADVCLVFFFKFQF